MSATRPWMKFYPTDWRGDQALRVVSLGARGLWIECMCIMHEASPYGHLIINGHAVTDAQLAALAGTVPDQITALLNELETAGVFSRNRNGVIYSRRMTRDEKKRKDGEKSEKTGTLPNSRRGKQASEKSGKNPPPPGVDGGVVDQPPLTQKPEAREEPTKEATASLGADGANENQEPSERDLVWKNGLRWLMKQTGLKEPKARGLISAWCKGGNEALLLSVLRDCRDHQPPIFDVVPWIFATLEDRKTRNVRQAEQHRPAARTYGEDADTRRRAIFKSLAGDVEPSGAAA
ncbi:MULTISPECIES: hypothetical protein [unclassified Azospirillum]|uniref:hypothetical protein n=1 Tax=unclassified Azospirillum TaxID=2630922 RepID=UPI000D64425E|nr:MULTISPECIES: hypothetical protein [unclassified Azospirillum]